MSKPIPALVVLDCPKCGLRFAVSRWFHEARLRWNRTHDKKTFIDCPDPACTCRMRPTDAPVAVLDAEVGRLELDRLNSEIRQKTNTIRSLRRSITILSKKLPKP